VNPDAIPNPIKRTLEKVRATYDYFDNPCDVPFPVQMYLAFTALGKPLLMLLDFGLTDIARAAFRPQGIKGHRKLLGKLPTAIPSPLPDIGEWVGKQLRNIPVIEGIAEAAGSSRALGVGWQMLSAGEKLLWNLLVIEAAAQWGYGYTKLVKKWEYCKKAKQKRTYSNGWQTVDTADGSGVVYDDGNLYQYGWFKVLYYQWFLVDYPAKNPFNVVAATLEFNYESGLSPLRITFNLVMRNTLGRPDKDIRITEIVAPGETITKQMRCSGRGNIVAMGVEIHYDGPLGPDYVSYTTLRYLHIQERGPGTLP